MDGKRELIETIQKDLSDRFRVIDNTGNDKKIVAGLFPDIILMRQEPPKNDDILFVMKIEKGDIINSIAEWREFDKSPYQLYIVVPDNKLPNARQLANAVDVSVRFASYKIDKNGTIKVEYE